MPTYLRKFYYTKLVEVKKEEQKEMEKSSKANKAKILRPNIPRR